MSDYCTCCATNTAHIRAHYDPDAITKPNENPEDVLRAFRACFPDEECPLTIGDVQSYLQEMEQE